MTKKSELEIGNKTKTKICMPSSIQTELYALDFCASRQTIHSYYAAEEISYNIKKSIINLERRNSISCRQGVSQKNLGKKLSHRGLLSTIMLVSARQLYMLVQTGVCIRSIPEF
jgi:hypothetical protein